MAQQDSRQLSDSDHLEVLENSVQGTNRYLLKKILFLSKNRIVPVFYRTVELIIGIAGLLFPGVPVLFCLVARKFSNGKTIFVKETLIGINGKPIVVYYFNLSVRSAAGLPLLFSVMKGDLALVGMSLARQIPDKPEPENNYLLSQKPGLLSLWKLRSSCKIGHEGFKNTEWEYCFTRSPLSDALIAMRSIPMFFLGESGVTTPPSVTILDVSFNNLTMTEAVENFKKDLGAHHKPRTVFFVNADCLNKSCVDSDYAAILQNGDYVLPDGIGINIACRMVGTSLKGNVNGTDLLPFLCEMATSKSYSMFLLGGRPGVAEKMAENIKTSYGTTIAGVHHGHFDHRTESGPVADLVNKSGADILLVAFGAPLQEKWIATNRDKLTVSLALGVGGLFDFYSGQTRRAPRWFRELGLEWVYRMIQEPGRMWRRYVIGNPLFLYRVRSWRKRGKTDNRRVKQ